MLNDLTAASKYFTIVDIKKGQREEYWISRVKQILKQPTRSTKKYNHCYGKKQSCLLVMMISYTVKIRSNTKSFHGMLLRKQFLESCIST